MKTNATFRFSPWTPARRSGFSLVEMVTVVVMIGLLLSIAVPSITKVRQNILRTQSIGTVKLLAGGCDQYYQELSPVSPEYPPSRPPQPAGTLYGGYAMEGRHLLVECLTGYLPETVDGADVNGFGFRVKTRGTVRGPYNGAENVKTTGPGTKGLAFIDSFGNEFYYYRYEKRGTGASDPTQFWKDDNDAKEGLSKPFPGDNRVADKVFEDYLKSGGRYFTTTYAIMSAGPDRAFQAFSIDPTTDDVTSFLPE